jgi:hypothetical protein
MEKIKRLNLILLIFMGLFIVGCSFVEVVNTSELSARVNVAVPDSGGGTTEYIKPGGTMDVFSTTGGRYTVQVLPDEKYRQLLLDLQNEITKKLFDERDTLTGNDVTRLVNQLNDIDDQLERLAEEGTSCQGTVPDYETVVVIMSWDQANSNWSLSCP